MTLPDSIPKIALEGFDLIEKTGRAGGSARTVAIKFLAPARSIRRAHW